MSLFACVLVFAFLFQARVVVECKHNSSKFPQSSDVLPHLQATFEKWISVYPLEVLSKLKSIPILHKFNEFAHNALHGIHYGGDMLFKDEPSAAAVRDISYRWPGYPGKGIIPYVFDSSITDGFKRGILRAMQQYHDLTCIRFVKWKNQKDRIRIYKGNGCNSFVGRIGEGEQNVSLGAGCEDIGTVVHELGHAVGMFHEHQRSDRNQYITVYPENVIPGRLINFKKTDPSLELIFVPYDYNSIMHYSQYAFGKETPDHKKLKTMVAKNKQELTDPYAKPGLDHSDVKAIRQLYQCE